MSNLLIIGASVRAAVQSAASTPWTIFGMDMFGDIDTCTNCQFQLLDPYPEQAFRSLGNIPIQAVCITGAIENHPHLLQHLAASAELYAPSLAQISRLRDPFELQRQLTAAGFAYPTTLPSGTTSLPGKQKWLSKPVASAAGLGISKLESLQDRSIDESRVLQQFIDGRSLSATFLTHPNQTHLLGVTKQLLGEAAFNAKGFQYCGSIGPLVLSTSLQQHLLELGSFLQREYKLRGLIGVDFVLQDNRVWVIEINPRYTASMELLESAMGRSLIQLHLDSFSDTCPDLGGRPLSNQTFGKAILFASEEVTIPPTLSSHWEQCLNSTGGDCADLPLIGSTIARGHPLFTVFAQGETVSDTFQRLCEQARYFDAILMPSSKPMPSTSS